MKHSREFLMFLRDYRVAGLAIAFVIGVSVKDLVSATVDDLMMPVIELFLPGGSWENAILEVHGMEFGIGHFFSTLIEFVIVALLVFLVVKYLLGMDDVEKI